LIQNVWYWRARLVFEKIEITNHQISVEVSNLGHSSTANATLNYYNYDGELLWNSENFGVNATNHSKIIIDANNLSLSSDGFWSVTYQKRVVDSSQWVEESINQSTIIINSGSEEFLPAPSLFTYLISIISAAFAQRKKIKN